MTLEVTCMTADLKVTALIVTGNLETHSAFQEIPKIEVDNILYHIQGELTILLELAKQYRKQP